MKLSNTFLVFAIHFLILTAASAQIKSMSSPNIWQKGATYEVFVMSFCDSNNDGVGDLAGLTSKLDYIANLGVEAVWLMPITPSPSYHKYDVTDYYGIDPEYGTIEDFKTFVKTAHQKNLKVIIDFVINQTAAAHPWFVSAKKGKDSPYRDYYVWTSDRRLISKEPKNWFGVEGQAEKFYANFWSEMPDLNLDNVAVREEVKKIGRYWLTEMGVDGFRIDAARHIFPYYEDGKNLVWWSEFSEAMKQVKKDVYLIGEVTLSDSALASYFKAIPVNFNFDLTTDIINALRNERDTSIVSNLLHMHSLFSKVNPNFIDASCLNNHDLIRLGSFFSYSKEKWKLAASILFTLPVSPYLYYGEEIGMLGEKPDEYLREPFIWSENLKNNTQWIKAMYSTNETVVPFSLQERDTNSLYNHYKSLLQLRKNSATLTLGSLVTVTNANQNIIVYKRAYNKDTLFVVHNLSAKPQKIENQWSKGEVVFKNSGKSTGSLPTIDPYSTYILSKPKKNKS